MGVADMIVTIGADISDVESKVASVNSDMSSVASSASSASAQMSGLAWVDGSQMVTNVDVAQANLTLIESKVAEAQSALQALQDSAQLGVELPGADVAAANLTILQAKAQEARASLADLQSQEDGAGGSATNLGGMMSEASGGFINFTSQVSMTLMGLQMLGQGAVSLASSLLQPAETAETTQLSFTTLLHSSTAAQQAMTDLNTYAAGTPMQTQWVDNAAAKILAFGGKMGDVKPEINAIGDSLSGLGKLSEASLGSIVDVFGKISAQGKITGGDMMQLSTWGIPAWQALSDSMGKPIPELQKMVSAGIIPADTAIKALEGGMEKTFGGGMAAQANTFSGLMSTLASNWQIAMASLGSPVLKQLEPLLSQIGATLSSPAFQQFATTAGQKIVGAFTSIGSAVSGTVKFFQQNQAAMESLKVVGLIVAGIMVASFGAWAIAAGSAAVATIAATWPILAIGAGIGLLVAGFMALYNNVAPFRDFMNQLGAGFQNVWSIISSNFMPIMQQLGGFLASVFVPVWQQMVQVWQNQLVPAWTNLMAAIQPIMPQLQAFGQFLGVLVGSAVLAVIGLIGGLVGALGGLMTGVAIVIGGIGTFLAGAVQYMSGLVAFFVDLFTLKFDKLGGDLGTIWGGIVKMFQGAWQVIEGIFVGAINSLIGLINGFVAGVLGPINSILTASGQAALSVGQIPLLTVNSQGGLAAAPAYQSPLQQQSATGSQMPGSSMPAIPSSVAMPHIATPAGGTGTQTGTSQVAALASTSTPTTLAVNNASSTATSQSQKAQDAANARSASLAASQQKAISTSSSSQVAALVAQSQQQAAMGNTSMAAFYASQANTLANQQKAAATKAAIAAKTAAHHQQVLANQAARAATSAAKHQQALANQAAKKAASQQKHQQVLAAAAQRHQQVLSNQAAKAALSAQKHQQTLANQASAQQTRQQQTSTLSQINQTLSRNQAGSSSSAPIYTMPIAAAGGSSVPVPVTTGNIELTVIWEIDGTQFTKQIIMPAADKIVRLKLGAKGRPA